MNFLLVATLLVSFMPCLVYGGDKDRVWLYGVMNGAPRPIYLHVLNVTCWNLGNFTKTPYSIPASSVRVFKSSEDHSSSSCASVKLRKLYLNFTDAKATTERTAVIEEAVQNNICNTTIYIDGKVAQKISRKCKNPMEDGIMYHPPSLKFPLVGGSPFRLLVKKERKDEPNFFRKEHDKALE